MILLLYYTFELYYIQNKIIKNFTKQCKKLIYALFSRKNSTEENQNLLSLFFHLKSLRQIPDQV